MADEGFREVQLTGKKLVFLFMVGAVVLVVIFLLGVMVGRGVRGPAGGDNVAPIEAAQVPGEPGALPPPTKPAPGDLDYNALVGGDAKKAIEPPPTPPDAADTPATPPATAADASKAPAAKAAAPAAKAGAAQKNDQPAKSDAAKPDAAKVDAAKPDPNAKAATPASGQWVVQVAAYSKKATADSVVASLKKKNIDAFVVHDGPLYHVQVGPFTDKADADRAKASLQKEGFKPLIKR